MAADTCGNAPRDEGSVSRWRGEGAFPTRDNVTTGRAFGTSTPPARSLPHAAASFRAPEGGGLLPPHRRRLSPQPGLPLGVPGVRGSSCLSYTVSGGGDSGWTEDRPLLLGFHGPGLNAAPQSPPTAVLGTQLEKCTTLDRCSTPKQRGQGSREVVTRLVGGVSL